jgi:hypothetical protein
MACRTLLLKLERLGEIRLPPRQRPSQNANRNRQIAELLHDSSPIEGDLRVLRPLKIEPLEATGKDAAPFKFLLYRYHYLGYRNCVGESLKYMIRYQLSIKMLPASLLPGVQGGKSRTKTTTRSRQEPTT